ncbi:MAG: Na+/H+ antiporter NhaC family protein [Clostridia bacterium]|nr:Na+/H+ antiporter NhaC family protein [Clostridia bacterium]
MVGTFWAFVPAIVAIVLALLTKQVYVSLFIGILVGALLYAGGNPLQALGTLYTAMSEQIGGNTPIIVFLVVLGIFVVLMQKSGGSKAYGEWAQQKIKSKEGALGATAALGCLIFVDDYFNCLTVGSVMRPITDKFKVSHSKLAYIIDSTAAPVCIIAPISSWAAAVSGYLEGDGLVLFINTIPFNIYALLTIVMVFVLCFTKLDFGKMKRNEYIAETTGDLDAGETDLPTEEAQVAINPLGKVRHLIIPVIVLIVCCIGGMIYSGFFYDWETYTYGTTVQSSSVIEAFSNCDAGTSLAIGSTVALIIVAVYYLIEKVVSFKEITESFTQGFKTMVPAILILTFAWTISGIMGAKGGYLDAQAFVQSNIEKIPEAVQSLFPAIFFVLACAIAFSTGTSWGTFGVLVPIAVAILGANASPLVILTISATLGGAVFGDHVSPISDTTILASTGGNCNHVDHVKTQLPYALTVAGISFVAYIVAGFIAKLGFVWMGIIAWAVVAVLFVAVILLIKYLNKKNATEEA